MEERYLNIEKYWQCVQNTMGNIFGTHKLEDKGSPTSLYCSEITNIIISYDISAGLDSNNNWTSLEKDNTPDYAYLYAKLNADREKKSKGGAIKKP